MDNSMTDLIAKLHNWLLRLDSMEPDPPQVTAESLFVEAAKLEFENRKRSLQLAQEGLAWLAENKVPRETYRYLQGKLALLMGLLHLHQADNDSKALDHLTNSRTAFRVYKWLQFEALTNLALCVVLQKLNRWAEAKHTAQQGLDLIDDAQLLTPREGDWILDDVAEALSQQLKHINNHRPSPSESTASYSISLEGGISLTVFPASVGVKQSPGKRKSELDFLSRKTYQEASGDVKQTCYIDPKMEEAARKASYILEIDSALSTLESGLRRGDWLFIQAKTSADDLNKKKVLLLEKNDDQLTASLKLFDEEPDHFFMESLSTGESSVLVKSIKTDKPDYLRQYYAEQYPNLIEKPVYPLWVAGEVIAHVPQAETDKLQKRYVWRIPVIKQVAAGLGWPIDDADLSGWHHLENTQPQQGNYFAFRVQGDSMRDAGIETGQLVLIRHHPHAEKRQIAAVVVDDLSHNQRYGFIKQFYFDDRPGVTHWFLKSQADDAPHIVVIDPESEASRVLENYQPLLDSNKLQVYEKARLHVIGLFERVLSEGA